MFRVDSERVFRTETNIQQQIFSFVYFLLPKLTLYIFCVGKGLNISKQIIRVMDKQQECLYGRMIDIEIASKNNRIYTMLLITIGLLSIITSTIALILQELMITGPVAAFFVMGLILFFGGYLWRAVDQKKMQKIQEDYEQLDNIQEEGERVSSSN